MLQAYSHARYQTSTKLTHKYTGEFGIRDVRYVDYRVALVGEVTTRFLSDLAQNSTVSYPEFT